MDKDKKRFIAGFNGGYFIARFRGPLAKLLANIKLASAYMEGFRKGKQEYEYEREEEQLNELRTQNKDKTPDLER